MPRPLASLALLGLLVAAPACGTGRLIPVSGSEPEDREPRPAPAQAAAPAYASQLSLDRCRAEVARRRSVPDSRVRTRSRGYDSASRVDLVDWEIAGAAAGYCRVSTRGTVLQVATERTGPASPSDLAHGAAPSPAGAPAPAPAPAATPAPRDDEGDAAHGQVREEQLGACRAAVARQLDVGPDAVGLSAARPDDRGTVLIDWSLASGRQGTCLVDAAGTVVQFRTG